MWSPDFWALFDAGAWKVATQASSARYSNTCICGSFVDSYPARVTHVTWGSVHMALDQSSDVVTVSLRDFVDMNPEHFSHLALAESGRSQGCDLCHDKTT